MKVRLGVTSLLFKALATKHTTVKWSIRIQGFFAAFLQLNHYFVASFRQVFKDETVVFKSYFVPLHVTRRSVAKVLSLAVLPTL